MLDVRRIGICDEDHGGRLMIMPYIEACLPHVHRARLGADRRAGGARAHQALRAEGARLSDPMASVSCMDMTAVCPRCGEVFKAGLVAAGGRRRKHCSRGCAFPGQVMATAICEQCAVTFTRRANQIGPYCSPRCAGDALKVRWVVACARCGEPVQRSPWQDALSKCTRLLFPRVQAC